MWTDCVQEEGKVWTQSGPQKSQNAENQALIAHTSKRKGRRFPYKKDKGTRHSLVRKHKTRDLSKVKCYNYKQFLHFPDKFPQNKRKGKKHATVVDVEDQPQKRSKVSKFDELVDGIQKEYFFISTLSGTITNNSDIWLIDSGDSKHMTRYRSPLSEKDSSLHVELCDNAKYVVQRMGSTSF